MDVIEPIIKQSTIDFVNKWNVGLELKSEQDYDNYVVEASKYSFYPSPFGSRWGIKWHKSNSNDRSIIMSNCFYNKEKNSDRIVFHELCHSIFEITPNLIDDFKSPLFILDYKMVIDSGVSHGMQQKHICALSGASNFNDLYNEKCKELIEQGLLTESGEFTFDRSKVNSKESWFKDAKCMAA